MPTTVRGDVPFDDLPSGYAESFRRDGVQVRRPVLVDWERRKEFAEAMLGYTTLESVGGVLGLNRRTPERHPIYPRLYAASVEFSEALGAIRENAPSTYPEFYDSALPLGGDGKLQGVVTYTTLPYAVELPPTVSGAVTERSRYLERHRAFNTDNLILPGNYFKFVNADGSVGPTIPEGPVRLVGVVQHDYVWHEIPTFIQGAVAGGGGPSLPQVLEQTIQNTVGKVNSVTFERYPAETLLCLTPQVKLYNQANGDLVQTITYQFIERPRSGWQKLFRASIEDYQLVTSTGLTTGVRIYEKTDFNDLFTSF